MTTTAARGAVTSAAAVVALSVDQGGFAPSAWRWGTVGLAAAAGLFWLWSPRPALTWRVVALPGLLAGFALWSVASALWSLDASVSLLDAQRTLLYVAAACCFALAGPGLVAGVLGGTTIVAVWALGGRLIHGARIDPYEGRLLVAPLGYANGLGALMAIGAAVALGLALRSNKLFAAPLVLLVPALVLTDSRGAEAAAVVGCAVAVSLHLGRRGVAAATLGISGAGLALLLLVTPSSVGNRVAYWDVARHIGVAHPLAGDGAGTFHLVYHQLPPAHDAHSLYLQAFAELGVIGLALVIALVALPLVWSVRNGLVAPAAGLTVFALHAGVDWDWQLPAVTVAALALAAASMRTCVRGGGDDPPRRS